MRKSSLSIPGEEVRAEPVPRPTICPELDPGVDRLEEDQVRRFRNVDASVQHVHGDGDVGGLSFPEKSSMRLWAYFTVLSITRRNVRRSGVVPVEPLL